MQKGLFEEEANRDYRAAIEAYEGIASHAEEQRKIMATAVFRLGECYRKVGKTNEAAASYQRLLREFPEQGELGGLGRQQLAGLGRAVPATVGTSLNEPVNEETKELERLQRLIRESPDLLNGKRGAASPLTTAVSRGHLRVAEFLLSAGARVNEGDPETPLNMAVGAGNQLMVELLVAKGADVNKVGGNGPPLVRAAAGGHRNVAKFLLEHQANINGRNGSGETALHVASANGFQTMVNLLVDAGADVNAADGQGNTPFLKAIAANQTGIAKMLLDHKADINKGNNAGQIPLTSVTAWQNEELLRFILSSGAKVNMTNAGGATALGVAATSGSTNIVSTLLAAGAEVDFKDPEGRTPIFYAISQGRLPILEVLAQNKANVNATARDGTTPLFAVIESGNNEVQAIRVRLVEWLLAHHADPNTVDEKGRTLFSLLRHVGGIPGPTREEIKNLLLRYGAKYHIPNSKFISAIRADNEFSSPIFYRATEAENGFTLFEALASLYVEQNQPHLMFPDFSRLQIQHLDGSSTKIDFLSMVQAKECEKDQKLGWGDAIEIPEANHLAMEPWIGLSSRVIAFLTRCLTRKVEIITKGESKILELRPKVADQQTQMPGQGRGAFIAMLPLLPLRLDNVVKNSRVLRISSDTTRVVVKRQDPAGGAPHEMAFDLTTADPRNNLLLHDGDVIEIPEKP